MVDCLLPDGKTVTQQIILRHTAKDYLLKKDKMVSWVTAI